MPNNTSNLIETLRQGLCGRFSNVRVVNHDPVTGLRRNPNQGVFSVVFRAHDEHAHQDVALKFFDPDYQGIGLPYRMNLFEREARLLERLRGKRGLLQLAHPLSEMQISASEGSQSVTLTCVYFAMEWLDGDIEEYFLRQPDYDALVKIALFRQIVLGVFRLHREQIAHRDLKADNLKQVDGANGSTVVVPIDLGTAIDLASSPIGAASDYDHPVGASGFSPLEAQVGLANLRGLAKATDVYALGCLLHDLFNLDFHFMRLWNDPGFLSCHGACKAHLSKMRLERPRASVLSEYRRVLGLTKHQVTLPSIDSDDAWVPDAAREPLNRLLLRLTDVDYSNREYDLDKILRLLDIAANNLKQVLMQDHRRRIRNQRRTQRERKLQGRQARLELYLQQRASGECSVSTRH